MNKINKNKINKNNINIKKLVILALISAFISVGTLIQVPVGLGNINLGDTIILTSAYFMGSITAICALIGAGSIDLLTGYTIYLPATIIIKALIAFVSGKYLFKKQNNLVKQILVFGLCELIMIFGYFLYNIIIFGLTVALSAIAFDFIQAIFGIIGAVLLTSILSKNKYILVFLKKI